jgi:mono/diheme cytochrome c family protein
MMTSGDTKQNSVLPNKKGYKHLFRTAYGIPICALIITACQTYDGEDQVIKSREFESRNNSQKELTYEERDASITRGKMLVEANCLRCHARFPEEVSSNKSAPSFANLFVHYPPEYIAESFAEGVFMGHQQMPPFEFSAREVGDLVAYLKDLENQPR